MISDDSRSPHGFCQQMILFLAMMASALLAINVGEATCRADRPSAPNIVLIMADDIGYSDIGCFGGEIKTPNLDALAAGGLRFTQFYNVGRCCPTRASLLTGLYPHQAGVGHMTDDRRLPGYTGGLNRHTPTIAEALRPAGYRTYMVGKWHVTKHFGPASPNFNWPKQRGFDKFYGTITGAGSFYDPTTLCRDNTFITPDNDSKYKPETFYYTDAISDNAIMFIQEHERESGDRPFFLYVAYTSPHWPLHALESDIAKYKGEYDGGYTPVRAARIERLRKLGLLETQWDVSPQVGDWSRVSNKEWEARCMEVYAAMVDRMDQGIGRIINELKKQGRLDNTLVLYLQDNGGCAEGMGRGGPNRPYPKNLKPMGSDQLQKSIWPPMQTRDGRPVRVGPEVMPGPADTYIAYGRDWANVSNTPFREYKHYVHEGGIATPLIAHWPSGIAARLNDGVVREPSHLIDIMATCLDITGTELPATAANQPTIPLEGVSLQPAFLGKKIDRPASIFWEHEGNRAIRDGKWKLVAKGAKGKWELYDMHADRTEMHDLAETQTERTDDMAAAWESWATRTLVKPWPWGP